MEPVKNDVGPLRPNSIERLFVALSTYALLTMGALVGINVLSRILSIIIIPDTVLLIKELMVYVIVLPMAFLAGQRENISVTVFTERLGSSGKFILSILSSLVGLIFSIFIVSAAWRLLSRSISSSEYYYGILHIPQWIGHLIFLAGFLLLMIRLIYMIIVDARNFLSKD